MVTYSNLHNTPTIIPEASRTLKLAKLSFDKSRNDRNVALQGLVRLNVMDYVNLNIYRGYLRREGWCL